MKRALVIVLFALLLVAPVLHAQEIGLASLAVPAVDSNGNGVITALEAEIISGKGRILLNVFPYTGIETQNSERIAVAVAQEVTGKNFSLYDVIFTFETDAHVVDGPSAGAAMTVALIAAVENKPLLVDASLTGTIQADGTIGPVGGIKPKLEAAAGGGATVFLIPLGERLQPLFDEVIEEPAPGFKIHRRQISYVDVVAYGETLGVTVLEVSEIEDVVAVLLDGEDLSSRRATQVTRFDELPKKEINEHIAPMSIMTTHEIERAQTALREAEDALSASNLEAEEELSVQAILANSKSQLDHAERAFELGYLYTAANFAFRSRIDSAFARDFTVFQSDETVVTRRMLAVSTQLTRTGSIMHNSNTLVEDHVSYPWALAAQERFTQVETQLARQQNDSEANLYSLAVAEAWLQIAEDFYSIAVDVECTFERDLSSFEETARMLNAELPIEGEQPLNVFDFGPAWRAAVSRTAMEHEWWVSSTVSARIANIRRVINEEFDNTSADERFSLVESEVLAVQPGESVWAQLYLDHAEYMLYLAEQEGSTAHLRESFWYARQATLYADQFNEISELPLIEKPLQQVDTIIVGLVVVILFAGWWLKHTKNKPKSLHLFAPVKKPAVQNKKLNVKRVMPNTVVQKAARTKKRSAPVKKKKKRARS